MHPRQQLGRGVRPLTTQNMGGVKIAPSRQPTVSVPSVRMHLATWSHAGFDKGPQALRGGVGNSRQTNAPDALTLYLCRDGHQGLILAASPAWSLSQTAHVGFIDFHLPSQAIPPRTHHRAAQLMEPTPGGQVMAQTQHPLQSQSAGPVLLAGDVPDRPKPQPQGLTGVLKNGPSRDCGLMAAGGANPALVNRRPSLMSLTTWAHKSIGPAQSKKIGATGFLGGEPLLKRQKGSRIIFSHLLPLPAVAG